MSRRFAAKHTKRQPPEFEQKLVDLARVTRVVAGGRRFRFRAAVVIGNRKGKVGIGVAKGADVTIAVEKAVAQAKKELVQLTLAQNTITHSVRCKYKSAIVLLKPARPGTGLIAGGAVRAVVELAGIRDIVSKMLGSKNKINNMHATLEALSSQESLEQVAKRRGKAQAVVQKSASQIPLESKKYVHPQKNSDDRGAA